MSEPDPSIPARRAELDQAFRHLQGLADTVDLTGVTDPKQQWLRTVRTTVAAYGEVGPLPDLDGVSFTPVSAGGVPALWVTAEGARPAHRLVYLHGGGWAAGSPTTSHRALAAVLARLSGLSILMVDYRLAPEHPYPAPLDDCVTAYEWALANGPTDRAAGPGGSGAATWMGVAGDSAGGNLAAATCVRLAMAGGRMPDRLAVIAGTLDNVSMWDRVGIDDVICTPESLTFSVAHYLQGSQSAADPLVSPAFAPTEVLARFPPTLLQVSALEALLHDSRRFSERLEKAGVRVNLSIWPDVPHVWHAFLGLFPEAEAALGEIADFMRR